MTVMASGTVIVISTMGMPPAQIASTALAASSTAAARTTGTIPISPILRITSSMVIWLLAFPEFQRSIRAVCVFMTCKTSARLAMDVSPGVVIASAPWAAPHRSLVEMAVVIADGAPVVQSRGFCISQSSRNDCKIGELTNYLFNHPLKVCRIEVGVLRIQTSDWEAKRRREILFIPNHYVDERGQAAIDLLSFGFSPDRFPQRRTIVEIVGNNRAGPLRRFHGF